mgnify:CR=1 FL=1
MNQADGVNISRPFKKFCAFLQSHIHWQRIASQAGDFGYDLEATFIKKVKSGSPSLDYDLFDMVFVVALNG